ncbi:MAG: SGNH/GDSL hydrolase family protein [Syntrophomonadaceae bacterium]|nr:SGNH/GDSL hydrolase family protein [Syntrophomonadaceae bacterium]
MSTGKIRVVCLGDSITWGFPFGHEASWVTMLDDAVDGDFINQGINGNTTTDMLNRFDRAVVRDKPTHVIIMGGLNDVLWRESYDRIILNLQTMIEKAQAAGIKVVMGTPTALDEPEMEIRVDKIRHWIKDYCRKNNIPVIDFAAAFFDGSGKLKTDLLLPDGGHPTRQGYQAIFDQIDFNVFA